MGLTAVAGIGSLTNCVAIAKIRALMRLTGSCLPGDSARAIRSSQGLEPEHIATEQLELQASCGVDWPLAASPSEGAGVLRRSKALLDTRPETMYVSSQEAHLSKIPSRSSGPL